MNSVYPFPLNQIKMKYTLLTKFMLNTSNIQIGYIIFY